MIIFDDVSKIYQIGGEEVRALNHASMQIDDGEFVSIVGPSGSGKSTMMNIIGCLDMADQGTYSLDGQPISDYSEKELARIRNKKIGFILVRGYFSYGNIEYMDKCGYSFVIMLKGMASFVNQLVLVYD